LLVLRKKLPQSGLIADREFGERMKSAQPRQDEEDQQHAKTEDQTASYGQQPHSRPRIRRGGSAGRRTNARDVDTRLHRRAFNPARHRCVEGE